MVALLAADAVRNLGDHKGRPYSSNVGEPSIPSEAIGYRPGRDCFHFRNSWNSSSEFAGETTPRWAPPCDEVNCRKSDCKLATSGLRADASHSSAGSKRFQPFTVTARLTSRHFGWFGGLRNSSILGKNASTNLWLTVWRGLPVHRT